MSSQNLVFDDSDLTSDSEIENTQPKRRGTAIDWAQECTYPNAESATAAINSENLWWKTVENNTSNGKKIMYICKVSNNCPSKVMLHFDVSSQLVTRYRVELPHHHANKNRKNGIAPEIKKVIADLFKSGVTRPKLILKNIASQKLPEPKLKQLNNYLTILRREIHENPDKRYFRLFITTKRLLSILHDYQGTLHADGTYKLLWQGFPVLVIGTSDKDRKFHMVGLAVTTSETQDDFKFLFETLKHGSSDNNYKPKVLVADCADAISNACNDIYGDDVVRVHCWAHVIRNIDKKLVLVPEEIREDVRRDILALQLSKSDDEFVLAKGLWIKKWKTYDNMELFCNYFIEEYLNLYDGWYEGRALASPSTNNCLESTNNVLKNEGTLRHRLPLAEFIDTAMNIIKQWSIERDPASVNCKLFSLVPTLSMKLMTESYTWYQLIKANPSKINRQISSTVRYFIAPGEKLVIKETDIKMHLNYERRSNWRNFDTFRRYQNSLWVVSIEGSAWENGSCTCPVFLKTYICKHLVGIAIFKKFLVVPDEAKMIPVGQKRKRGRPAKAKKAFLVQ